jgi:hypothetical protein
LLARAHPVDEFLDSIAKAPWSAGMPADAGLRHDEVLTERGRTRGPNRRRS